MSEKFRMQVYEALVEGAYEGLSGQRLLEFAWQRCPKATEKLIINASALALSDFSVTDPDALRALYGLTAERGHGETPMTFGGKQPDNS